MEPVKKGFKWERDIVLSASRNVALAAVMGMDWTTVRGDQRLLQKSRDARRSRTRSTGVQRRGET